MCSIGLISLCVVLLYHGTTLLMFCYRSKNRNNAPQPNTKTRAKSPDRCGTVRGHRCDNTGRGHYIRFFSPIFIFFWSKYAKIFVHRKYFFVSIKNPKTRNIFLFLGSSHRFARTKSIILLYIMTIWSQNKSFVRVLIFVTNAHYCTYCMRRPSTIGITSYWSKPRVWDWCNII